MGRSLRIQGVGAFVHVTTRGNNKRSIYLDDADRHRFLTMVGELLRAHEWRCLSYCLMGHHYHLVVRTSEPTLSAGMQWLNGGYARSFNIRHARQDHLFGKRFHSEIVLREEHGLELARYVVLNPVRAGFCRRPEDWPWSSYRATAGMSEAPRWFDRSDVLGLFDPDPRRALARYVTFVDAAMS